MADPVSIVGVAIGAASLAVSAPGAGISIASLTGKNSSEYLTFEKFGKLYEGFPPGVIRRMWDKYSEETRHVEKLKDEYGYGVSCKMLFTNATDRTVHRDSTVIFMGKKTDDKRVSFFPSIPPGETKAAFHAKRDGAAVGCGGAMEFYLSDMKDQPRWAVGWKVPYSGDNVTDSQVATSDAVSEYLDRSHVVGTSSTTFLHDYMYQLDTHISPGTTAILHVILRKVKSYSWSANVCGRKEWLFLPPGAEQHLRDSLGNLPFDITSPLLKDSSVYPNAGKAPQPIRVVQEAGEVIFVPSGWFHQVKNLEDTISINHNWTNAFGLQFLWAHLQAEMKLVQKEIADCKEMEGWAQQCQIILKASAGMDYKELYQFLYVIAIPRLKELDSLCNATVPISTDTVQELTESTPVAATSLPFFHELRKCLSKANPAEFSFFVCECDNEVDTISPLESGSWSKLDSSLKARDNLGVIVQRILVPNSQCDHTKADCLHAMDCSHLMTSCRDKESFPFSKLFMALPNDVQIVLKCNIPDTDSLQFSLAVFRAFELNNIWIVLQELHSSPEFEAV